MSGKIRFNGGVFCGADYSFSVKIKKTPKGVFVEIIKASPCMRSDGVGMYVIKMFSEKRLYQVSISK